MKSFETIEYGKCDSNALWNDADATGDSCMCSNSALIVAGIMVAATCICIVCNC